MPGISADRLLDLLRIEMAAGADDDVLDAARDEDVAAGHIGAVAAVEPAVVKKLAGLGLVVEIAAGCRGSAEFKPAFAAVAEFATGLVDDADFVAGQRLTAGDDFQRIRIVGPRRFSHARGAQPVAVDAVDERPAAERRKRQSHRALREPVDRRHRFRRKTITAEPLDEPAQGLRR